MKVKLLSRVQLLATPWTATYQALPSMGFSRQEYWSGVPMPSPKVLPTINQNSHCITILTQGLRVSDKKQVEKTRGQREILWNCPMSYSSEERKSTLKCIKFEVVAVFQSLSHVRLFVILWPAALQASLSFTTSWSLFKLMSIEAVMPADHLILHHPPLLLPSIFPSIRVLSNVSALHIRWPKYWNFSFSTSN